MDEWRFCLRGFEWTHLLGTDMDVRVAGVCVHLRALVECNVAAMAFLVWQPQPNVVKVRGDVGERHILVPHNLNLCVECMCGGVGT